MIMEIIHIIVLYGLLQQSYSQMILVNETQNFSCYSVGNDIDNPTASCPDHSKLFSCGFRTPFIPSLVSGVNISDITIDNTTQCRVPDRPSPNTMSAVARCCDLPDADINSQVSCYQSQNISIENGLKRATCPDSSALTHCSSIDFVFDNVNGSIIGNIFTKSNVNDTDTMNICTSEDITNDPTAICCEQSGSADIHCEKHVGPGVASQCPNDTVMVGCTATNVRGIVLDQYIWNDNGVDTCQITDSGAPPLSARAVAIWYEYMSYLLFCSVETNNDYMKSHNGRKLWNILP